MINSEGEVVEEGDCPTTDEDSEMDSDGEVVWAKSARGTWAYAAHQPQGWTNWLQQVSLQAACHVWVQVWVQVWQLLVPPAFWGSTFPPGCPG